MRKYPCCLCPGVYSGFKKEDIWKECNFVNKFVDERGWIYFVRKGIGNNYKAFYKKPNSSKEKGCTMLDYKDLFMDAQIDLNALAEKKSWKIVV